MSAIKLFILILIILVGQLNPFFPLMLLSSNDKPSNDIVGEVPDVSTGAPAENVGYNITGMLTMELDGYCTIDVPQSHWELIEDSSYDSYTYKYLKYKDNRTRLLMGYVTDIPEGTDIPGYIVQGLAKVDMVTNSKQEVIYGDDTWMMVPSTEPINNSNVVIWYKLSKDGKSAFWMKATKDFEIDETEFNEVISKMISTYNMYYLSGSIFKTPTSGIYTDSESTTENPDGWRDNNPDNLVFGDRTGFVADSGISDNWRDMEIIMNEVKVALPCSMSELVDGGFSLYELTNTLDTLVGINSTQRYFMSDKYGTVITVTVYNDSKEEAKAVRDCYVTGIYFDISQFIAVDDENGVESNQSFILLPGGATVNVFTDDLIAAYGGGEVVNLNDNRVNITFKSDNKSITIIANNIRGIQSVSMDVVSQ